MCRGGLFEKAQEQSQVALLYLRQVIDVNGYGLDDDRPQKRRSGQQSLGVSSGDGHEFGASQRLGASGNLQGASWWGGGDVCSRSKTFGCQDIKVDRSAVIAVGQSLGDQPASPNPRRSMARMNSLTPPVTIRAFTSTSRSEDIRSGSMPCSMA